MGWLKAALAAFPLASLVGSCTIGEEAAVGGGGGMMSDIGPQNFLLSNTLEHHCTLSNS